MPLRTIADVSFRFCRADGSYVDAQRGETVDVPKGDDLTRGDKFGAFTEDVNVEPAPPLGAKLIRPQLDWTSAEFDRYSDAAHLDEIKEHLEAVNLIDQPNVALPLLASENRKSKPRKAVVEYLEQKVGIVPVVLVPVDEGTLPSPLAPSLVIGEDLHEYAKTATVDEIVERAGADKDLAQSLLGAESAGKNRKTAVDQLQAIIEA